MASTPAQMPNPKPQEIARRRNHCGTAETSRSSNANHSSTLSQVAQMTRCSGWKRWLPSRVHNNPPAGCQPQNSATAVFSTSSQAAELTLQFASNARGRPNNAQVRNSS